MLPALGGLALMLYALVSILLTEGNQIGYLCKLLLFTGFIFGIVSPRGTLLVWFVSCGYLDLLKRLMVFSGRIFQDDLFYVLGVAPATFGGIVVGVLVHSFFGRLQLSKTHLGFFVISFLVVITSALMSMRASGMSLRALGPDVANNGVYAFMLFVIPLLYPDRHSVLRLLRFVIIGWLPVMAYGVYQQMYGFQDFEIEYLMKGLSMEIKQLFTDRVRAFSTLNSPTALGTIGGALTVAALVLGVKPQKQGNKRVLAMPAAASIALIYMAGMMSSTVRTSLLIPFASLAAAWAFRYRGITWLLYSVLILMFVLLLLSADFILNRIYVWNDLATTGLLSRILGQEMTTIGTFSDRLIGFRNILTNPEAYTLFGYGSGRGVDPSDPLYNHDLLSNLIVRYGCVPLTIIGLIGFFVVRHIHTAVHQIPSFDDRSLAAASLGISFAVFAVSMLSGNVLSTFPNNVVFWLMLSVTTLLAFAQPRISLIAPLPHRSPAVMGPRKRFPLRSSQRKFESF